MKGKISKSIKIFDHRIKDKKNIIISIDAEKESDKIAHNLWGGGNNFQNRKKLPQANKGYA